LISQRGSGFPKDEDGAIWGERTTNRGKGSLSKTSAVKGYATEVSDEKKKKEEGEFFLSQKKKSIFGRKMIN